MQVKLELLDHKGKCCSYDKYPVDDHTLFPSCTVLGSVSEECLVHFCQRMLGVLDCQQKSKHVPYVHR